MFRRTPTWLELAEGSDYEDSGSRTRRTSELSFNDNNLASHVGARNEPFAGLITELN